MAKIQVNQTLKMEMSQNLLNERQKKNVALFHGITFFLSRIRLPLTFTANTKTRKNV